MAASFEAVHEDLRALTQFCIRAGKQPYIRDGERKNSFTSTGWPFHRKDWLTFSEALEALRRGVKVHHEGGLQVVEGIGFLVARDGHDGPQTLGGDLDCCRDPETGFISSWAVAFLQKIRPFYAEVSPSGCGLRFFTWGRLPGGRNKVFGNGSQSDLLEESRERILTAKPKAREKLEKDEPAFCGLELYESGRHLTITGRKVDELCFPKEDQSLSISEALEPFLANEAMGEATEGVKREGRGGLPSLDILDVIDTSDFAESGGQLFGSHPILGSTTGRNLVVNPAKGVWAYMHNGINSGGDAWLWLACECGALAWEQAGAGMLKNKGILEKTLKHAVSRGLISEEDSGAKEEAAAPGPALEPGEEVPALEEILERIKADPRAIKDPTILRAMATMKAQDPVEFDLFIAAIKKAHRGIRVETINALIDKHILESEKAGEKKATKSPIGIEEKARSIAKRGDALKYLIWQAQRNHLGDIGYQKVLICSIASAASLTSNGIQPGGSGDKGSGKSDACAATYHLVPMDRRLDGSLSPMSLFYLQKTGRLQPGMILFSDDVEYEPIIPIYKRATARFQQGITHFTVSSGKTREAIELKIPPRMTWWLTAVESVANEQAFDRQYPISTDSSPAHKTRVAKEIAARRARKELRLAEDEGIEVAREIIADIFDNGPFTVLIPQADKAEWLKVADFRGQEQFWDLVDALVILRWRQRERDPDGWLIAEDQDLIDAKEILTGHKVAHYADVTEAEVKVIGVLMDGRPQTQSDLVKALGIAQSTLSERLKSIMAKSAIVTEDYEQGKKLYSINPNMDIGKEFWDNLDLVNIKIDNSKTYRSQKIVLLGCYRYVIGIPIGIIINNSSRIPSSLSVKRDESIEEDHTCGNSCRKCLGWKKDISSILISGNGPITDQNQQQEPLSDYDKSGRYDPIRTDKASSGPTDIPIRQTCGAVGDIEADLLQVGEQAKAKDLHHKRVAEKHTQEGDPKPADLAPVDSTKKPAGDLPQVEERAQGAGRKSDSSEKAVTSSPPAGFTGGEHSKLLRAVDRLRHKRHPLMIKSNYGASLISESGLTSDRIRPWLQAAGYEPRVLELSGLEIWEEGSGTEAKKDDPSCSSCPVALKGDKSVIRCDPCRYLARPEILRSLLQAGEAPSLIHQGQDAVMVGGSV